jgi:enoyl-CoA hydratase/carnithine racemase
MTAPILISYPAASVRKLTLNRPDQANAIDGALGDALLAALQEAASSQVRVVLIEARGSNFCGGFDFSGFEAISEGDLLLRFVRIEQILQILWNGPFVSITRAHGAAFGAGADLIASSTYRLGTPTCRFRFPGYRFGIALGTRRLGCLLGEHRARNILLANTTLGAPDALECGLLSHAGEAAELDEKAEEIVGSLGDLDHAAMIDLLRNVRQTRGDADCDLANLVRSAARPGIRERIASYRVNGASTRKR